MAQLKPHVHKFTKEATQKVNVEKRVGKGGTTSATDLIKLRICVEKLADGKVCGKTQAYDLERTLA